MTYRVQTRSATEAARVQMPKVHGTDKELDLNLKPEVLVKREGIPKADPEPPTQSPPMPPCNP